MKLRLYGFAGIACRGLCGIVFMAAAIAKTLFPAAFAHALGNVKWIPERFIDPLAMIVPAVEFALGAALLLGWRSRLTARIAFATLLLFTAVLLMLPKDIDCGCFGHITGALAWLSMGWGAIGRNLVLLSLTGWLAIHNDERRLQERKLIHA
jgi:uncharacterized membrane protein YphA (DoxX/SURF4 family)